MNEENDIPRSMFQKFWQSIFGSKEITTPEADSLTPDEMTHNRLQEIRRLANQNQPASKLKLPRGPKIIAEEKVEKAAPAQPQKRGAYIFPPLSLLAPSQARQTDSAEFHKARVEQLVQTLSEFGVKVQYGDIYTGPVVTRYEVIPAPGMFVEKIVSLEQDLRQKFEAGGLRVVASVPGKGTVGIEIPNRNPTGVCLREIIESKAWCESTAEIPIALGTDVTGKPVVLDLARMPHALIAGAPGTGKTILINSIITSLVYKRTPRDLRLIICDPTTVEMLGFGILPHMLVPVVFHPAKIFSMFEYMEREIKRRYKMFAVVGARNIADFNSKIAHGNASRKKAEELDAEFSPEERAAAPDLVMSRDSYATEIKKEKLPYTVCIINELADLMLFAPSETEACIEQLTQHGRAAGIHLILATQRPTPNVITSSIKTNIPCRIVFKVLFRMDSHTMLDISGADALIGQGDILFLPPMANNPIRVQGAFVSWLEINTIVEFLKRNGDPEYVDVQAQIGASSQESKEEEGAADDEEWDDKLVPQALDVIRSTKRASTSMIQHRLKIGYNRASRIMEILEADGIVGPENGSIPREILKDLDSL